MLISGLSMIQEGSGTFDHPVCYLGLGLMYDVAPGKSCGWYCESMGYWYPYVSGVRIVSVSLAGGQAFFQ